MASLAYWKIPTAKHRPWCPGHRVVGYLRIAFMDRAVAYREFHVPHALASHIECLWLLRAPDDSQSHVKRALPDNSVDIYIDGKCAAVIAGPSVTFREYLLSPGAWIGGLRIRAGAAGALIGFSAEELRDCTIPLLDLWPDWAAELGDRLCRSTNKEDRVGTLGAVLAARLRTRPAPDPLVAEAVRLSDRCKTGMTVRELCAALGAGERRLQRRFLPAVGYGPKLFLRVVRFQRLLSLMRRQRVDRDWASLALDAGYTDQAHMVNDVRAVAGASPGKLGL
jgi:AraC-like DNA-binding protein